MNRKVVSGIILPLLLMGVLASIFNVQPVEAPGTIYIRADGSIDPPTAPISSIDNITYTLTDNIYDKIVVERDNIVVDGAGYALEGTGSGTGIYLSERSNVTVKNTEIKSFDYGIAQYLSSNNTISENNITENNWEGIRLYWSSDNTIYGNNIIENKAYGIRFYDSSNNTISGNNIVENEGFGILLDDSSNNTISENNLTSNWDGIGLHLSSNYNLVSGNNITHNLGGIWLYGSSNNTVSGNSITNNWTGIVLGGSSTNNTISGNNITGNGSGGIMFYWASNNAISGNNIADNAKGIYLEPDSLFNVIHHNNFVGNTEQVRIIGSPANVWDDGYPSGGNYWSDYEWRYPDAEEIDDSGIWDKTYFIARNNQDNYPLMEPWAPTPPIPTTIRELKAEIERLGSEGEIDNQGIAKSLLAKLNVAQKLVDKGKIEEAQSILKRAFIMEVQKLTDIHITPEAAELLIKSAEYIIALMQMYI